MTFFAAVDTEVRAGRSKMHLCSASTDLLQTSSSSGIDKIFPDALRDPILRKVQFSEIPRIDELGQPRLFPIPVIFADFLQ